MDWSTILDGLVLALQISGGLFLLYGLALVMSEKIEGGREPPRVQEKSDKAAFLPMFD